MKNKTLKVNCLIIIVAMLCSMLFVQAGAAEIIKSGTCGENPCKIQKHVPHPTPDDRPDTGCKC